MNDDAAPGAASSASSRTGHRPGHRSHRSSLSHHTHHSTQPGSHASGVTTDAAAAAAAAARRRRRRNRALSLREAPSSAVMEKVHAGLKKKLKFFTELMAHLDMLVFAELCTLYYMDCSFFRLITRIIAQSLFLSPKSDDFLLITPAHRPHVYAVFLTNAFCMLIHLLAPLTVASEASRGYLHGGVLIDFIGQRAPTSRGILLLLDILILTLQCVMLAVHTEREKLRRLLMPKRRLSSVTNALLNSHVADGGTAATPAAANNGPGTAGGPAAEAPTPPIPPPVRWPGQNLDAEERGVLAGLGSLDGPGNVGGPNGIELQPLRPPSHRNSSARRRTLSHSIGAAPASSTAAAAAVSRNSTNTNNNNNNNNPEAADDNVDHDSTWESNDESNIRDEDGETPRRRQAEAAADYVLNSLSTGANLCDFYVIHALREASRDYQGVAAQSLQTFGYAARLARIATERGARLATRPQPQ